MNKAYIDIDSIFDTRLTTLRLVGDVDDISYLSRGDDNFKNIGEGLFKLLYSRRNRPILVNSSMTAIREILATSIMEIKERLIREGSSSVIDLDINHYPYLLNDDDKSKVLSTVRDMLNDTINVDLIYKNPRDLNFNDYTLFVSYDGMSLINIMNRKCVLTNGPKPSTMIILPSLIPEGIIGIERDTYFTGLMDALVAFIDMQFVNVTHFSSVSLIDKYNKGINNGTKKDSSTKESSSSESS